MWPCGLREQEIMAGKACRGSTRLLAHIQADTEAGAGSAGAQRALSPLCCFLFFQVWDLHSG